MNVRLFVTLLVLFILQFYQHAFANDISLRVLPVPITTVEQKQQNIAGGEGFQMILAIAYSQSNPGIIYLSSDTSQVWKSTNTGDSWTAINNGYIAFGGRSLFVHPRNPDIVFSAATFGKTYDRTKTKSPYHGIYLSTDGGKHWRLVHHAPFYKQESCGSLFALDSRTLSAAYFTIYVGTYRGDLLVSKDSGNSWSKTNFESGGQILEVLESPVDYGTILIASESGLYRYNGDVTQRIGKGLPSWPRSITVSKDNPGIIYAALGKYGVYKSIDGGKHFQSSFVSNNMLGDISDIEVSPGDANIAVFIRTGEGAGPYFTHDGGKHWQRPESINERRLIQGGGFYFPSPIVFHPTSAATALTSSNGKASVLKTTTGGRKWHYSGSGYRGGRLIEVLSLSNRSMIFGLTDHGLWRTDDGAQTFTPLEIPKKGAKSIGAGSIFGQNLFVSVGSWKRKHLLISQDEGKSWKDTGLVGEMRVVKMHSDNHKIIYADEHLSRDGGLTWKMLPHKIIGIDPSDNNKLYTLEEVEGGAQLLVSKDEGKHWKKIGSPLPVLTKSVNKLEIDPFSKSRLYVATGGGVWVFDSGKWRRSGKKQGLIPDVFLGMNINTILSHPMQPGLVFAGKGPQGKGSSNGLFYSVDYGESWKQVPDIISNTIVWSLNVNAYDGAVFVGTSHGIYRIDLI